MVLATIAAIAVLSGWDGGLAPVSSRAGAVPIYRVERDESLVALTFNGAWGPDYASEILDLLAGAGIRATFFVLNAWLEQNPDVAARVVEEGHEIAMHSASHADFTRISEEQIRSEVRANCLAIVAATGTVPRLFRPPSGAWDERTVPVVTRELGFPVIQWSVDSIDWERPGAEMIVRRVVSGLEPGAIALFHTNVPETVEALPVILERCRLLGLTPVTVSELLLPPPYAVDHTGRQQRVR